MGLHQTGTNNPTLSFEISSTFCTFCVLGNILHNCCIFVFIVMRRRRDTADHLLLASRFVACGCLDRLCWRGLCFRIFLTCRDSLVLAGSWFWRFLFILLLGPCSREAEKQAKVLPGRLQMKRPRPQKSAPGGSKIEPREGQHDLLEGLVKAFSWRI